MSKTSDYWKMRELENRHRQQTLDFLDAYNKQIDDIYKYMLGTVQKEIDAFYGKYASDEGITMAEAKKRAAQLDIEAYARKAKRYVANKTFTKKANAEMKLYNLTMKVNRLELLKSNMGLELVNGFDDLEKLFGDTLTAEGVKEFRRQAGILGETIVKDDEDRYKRLSDKMARASFHNATFSDRIWMHQDLLKGELNKALQQALISGASMERLARNIRNAFGVSTKNAQRLMRTEIRRMQTDVAMESYKRNGNEEYEYMALGRRPCEACRELDGNVYNVKKMEVGLNAPPMHPNCMCSTAPHVDEKAYQEWLDSFGETDGIDFAARRKERLAQRNAEPDFTKMSDDVIRQFANDALKTQFEIPKGANSKAVRTAVEVIYKFEKAMGGETLPGLSVRFVTGLKGVYAKYSDKDSAVLLPKGVNVDAVEESMRQANARYHIKWKTDKDYHATETFSGIIWHELGHAIDVYTGERLSRALTATPEIEASSVKVSAYAGSTQNVRVSKRSEAWAENYAAYMDGGKNKLKVPSEIVEMIDDYHANSRLRHLSGNGTIKKDVALNLARSKDIPTIRLPKQEYGKIMHELNNNLSKEERKRFIVMKAIGDYIYTIENYGFNDYRIIAKEPIDKK